MTIICAIHKDGETWIGADSRTSFGSVVYDHAEKWIVSKDGSQAVGLCGSTRGRYLLERLGEELFFQATAHTVSDHLRSQIIADDWVMNTRDGGPKWVDGGAIYADASGVWQICCDFSVNAVPAGAFVADGSGESEGRGAAYVLLRNGKIKPQEIVRTACEAACALDSGCGGEILVRRIADG